MKKSMLVIFFAALIMFACKLRFEESNAMADEDFTPSETCSVKWTNTQVTVFIGAVGYKFSGDNTNEGKTLHEASETVKNLKEAGVCKFSK